MNDSNVSSLLDELKRRRVVRAALAYSAAAFALLQGVQPVFDGLLLPDFALRLVVIRVRSQQRRWVAGDSRRRPQMAESQSPSFPSVPRQYPIRHGRKVQRTFWQRRWMGLPVCASSIRGRCGGRCGRSTARAPTHPSLSVAPPWRKNSVRIDSYLAPSWRAESAMRPKPSRGDPAMAAFHYQRALQYWENAGPGATSWLQRTRDRLAQIVNR